MKSWLQKRRGFSHDHLVTELKITTAPDYKNSLRMDAASFSELLEMATPLIVKNDTVMRDAIRPQLRLLATLGYLQSGASFEEPPSQLKHLEK